MNKLAKIFKTIGILILVGLILICIPFTIPKLFGINIYQIATGSMEPELPIGALIYVDGSDSDDIEVNDVISFYTGTDETNITTHRVVEINDEEEYFVTKGDANDAPDANTVPFSHLIGKQFFSINHIGKLADFINSVNGIILGIGLCIVILALWICSDILKKFDDESSESSIEISDKPTGNSKNKDFVLENDKSISNSKTVDSKQSIIKRIGYRYLIVYIVGFVMIIIAGFNIIKILGDYSRSNDLYDDLAKNYYSQGDGDNWYDMARVDMAKLQEENEDIVGWIMFENEDINYPVLKGEDDDEYLHTTYDGKEATAGSIFMEAENTSDFQDSHTIIYGHNMRNLSMFGKLKYYNRQKDYYKDHQYFQIFTKDHIYRYRIFAYNTVTRDSFIYKIPFGEDDDFTEFLDRIIKTSFNNDEIEVSNTDKLITLSTCSTSGENNRFVVHAIRVDEYESN